MPGVNDSPEQVAPILELASAAGAAYVTGIALHLRGEVRDLFFAWLRAHRPDLIAVYESLYRGGAYMPVEERRRLARLVRGPACAPGSDCKDRWRASARPAGRPRLSTTPASRRRPGTPAALRFRSRAGSSACSDDAHPRGVGQGWPASAVSSRALASQGAPRTRGPENPMAGRAQARAVGRFG